MKRISLLFSVVLLASIATTQAAEPNGYYNSAENKSGFALLKSLYGIINSHTKVSYSGGLNAAYAKTDVDDDGYIIDIYSNVRYKPGDNGSSATSIGQGWNKEHTIPQSYWGGGTDPDYGSDLFHVYPTDIRVNSQRSSFPYGECANGTRLQNGDSTIVARGKLGLSTYPGYSGTVFEPDDEYKGDLARGYFYMATCYNDEVDTWTKGFGYTTFAGNDTTVFTDWMLEMLLKWHRQDPVSEKEIKRNDIIYKQYQHNRNPFIDHPELAEYIWGTHKGETWTSGGVITEPKLTAPVDGSTFDMGETTVGGKLTKTLAVKGSDLTQVLAVTVSGDGFNAYPASITAENAMNGINLYITFDGTTKGTATGTLNIKSGEVEANVNLTAVVKGTLAAPVLNDPQNVGATAFTASWNAVENADTYTLWVSTHVDTPEAELLLDEDMSSGTTTWTAGGKTYKDNGYLRLGTSSGTGSVTSPKFDLTQSNGIVTVKTTARQYSNDSGTTMKVSVVDNAGDELDSETFTLTASDAVYTAVLNGAPSAGNAIMIESLVKSKRVQLKGVKVYAGDASATNDAPQRVVAEGDSTYRIISDISGTNYVVGALTRGGQFDVKVKAVNADGDSPWSNVISVNLLTENPSTMRGDANGDYKVDVSDVTMIINFILGKPSDGFIFENADVFPDGAINVSDVTDVINIILGVE